MGRTMAPKNRQLREGMIRKLRLGSHLRLNLLRLTCLLKAVFRRGVPRLLD